VWEARVNGRDLTFRLSGINNQNFIMSDEETGTWWQQVTGEAILGPLKGTRLKQVIHDELPFSTWKSEQPYGRVLRPDPAVAAKYAPADWDERMARFPTAIPSSPEDVLPPRELIIGIEIEGASKAYPLALLQKQSPVLDQLGNVPIVIVVGEDKKSVRAFDRRVDGATVEFFIKTNSSPLRMLDSQTGSEWSFAGKATEGKLTGKNLTKIPVLADYWFDWKAYHPNTLIYQ
jgi:hypothetical protein